MDARRNVTSVGLGFLDARFARESVAGDLEQLERHNRSLRRAATVRQATASQLLMLGVSNLPIAVVRAWGTYSVQRPALKTAEIRQLLDDPIAVLGEDPFPVVDYDTRWKAPLSTLSWGRDLRQSLDAALSRVIGDRMRAGFTSLGVAIEPDTESEQFHDELCRLAVGLSPLRRIVGLLLEWVRTLSPSTPRDELKGDLYRLASLLTLMERMQRLGWVVLAGDLPQEPKAWCTISMRLLDGFFMVDRTLAAAMVLLEPDAVKRYLTACNETLQSWVGVGEPTWPSAAFQTAAAPAEQSPSTCGWLCGTGSSP